ncbi:MAG: DUF362 domain-containing protein [Candidatus Eisenbacteria bacterium]|nr:DUF362 domain-containing protein [Candidatus Eisenbacteria bacterium]
MEAQLTTINRDRVEAVVHHGVRLLTGISETGPAFEALFPGLHSGSTIAVKVNGTGSCVTRWETIRGLLSGLAQMLGGTYDISQVVIYDPHNLYYLGYRCEDGYLQIDGGCPEIEHSAHCDSGYYPFGGHELSSFLVDRDFVINVPVLKSHDRPYHELTLALKNHYGSLMPQSLCNNIPGMLTVNADPYIKGKTALVLMDGLRGTYDGGPTIPPQVWMTYPEQTPNTLFFSTDPVTNEYWGRDTINAERLAHGWSPKAAPWIEEASEGPYNLGISDPEQMDVCYYDPTGVAEERLAPAAAFLAPNRPNPFSGQTRLRLRMDVSAVAQLTIADAAGRVVRHLAERRLAPGYTEIRWNGRDDRGRRLPAGTYFARLRSGRTVQTRPLRMLR